MKLETLKIRSNFTRKIGFYFVISKSRIYFEMGLGKLIIMVGVS
jgi:hypothetical protein